MRSKISKYEKIAKDLKSKINHSSSLESVCLPSERKLASIYNVSRVTIRNALSILEYENLIIRQQGDGTYINQNKISQPIDTSISFSKLAKEHGYISNTELVDARIKIANKKDIELLNLSKNDSKTVVYIVRKRYLNDQLVSIEVSNFKNDFSFLLDYDLEKKSIYNLIESRGYKLTIHSRTIEIIRTGNSLSKKMGVKYNTPVLLMSGSIKDQEYNIINHVQEYMLGDKFKFEF